MKKFAAVLFPIVALFAPGVHADGDSAPTGDGSWWYTPDGGFEAETAKGTVYYFDEATGMEKSSTITVDNDGNVSGSEVPFGNNYALKTAYEAMKAALQDAAVLKLHETAIETIGARLNSMYGQNMQLTIGIGGYKNTDSTISITPGKDGENAKFEIADNIPYTQMVDGRTLSDNGQGRFQLYSANAPADHKVDLLSNVADAGVYLPMLLDGYLRWGEWSGADTDVFEYKKRDGYKATRLELRGFKDDEYTMESSTLSKLLTSSDVDSWAKRGEVRIPVRWKVPGNAAGLYYLKIGDVIGGLGNPPDGASIEDHIEGNATNLAIKGWYVNAADEGVVLADLMTSEKSEGAQSGPTYHVLLRKLGEGGETNSIAYASLGDLHKMSWSTNWYNAVKDIAEDRATAIVNWNTNWVYLAGEIAKSKEATERYVDNALNWSTNWFASTTAMNAGQAEIKKYIDGQLDIITNALNAIESAKASVTSINNVKQYIDSVMDYQTNVIIATERAKTSGAIESTQKLVNDTFDILTNELAAIDKVVKDTGIETINTVKDYVDTKFDFETNVIVNTELAKLNGTVKSVSEFVDKTYDILTNQIDGINKVVESKQAQTIQTTKDYVQSVMDFQTNLIINTELAKLNDTVKSTKQLIDETYDILTNQIQGIHKVVEDENITTITTVKDYVDAKFDLETNVIVSVELAKQNQSIDDVKKFVDDTFALITNKLNGINDIIESGRFADIKTVGQYVEAALDIETNVVVNAKLAELNGSIEGVQSLVNDTFDILTNELFAIHGVMSNENVKAINTVKDYVDTKFDFETNVIVNTELAKLNGSIKNVSTFVNETYDVVTNELAAIHDVVRRGDVNTITSVTHYVQAELDLLTNTIVATQKALTNAYISSVNDLVNSNFEIMTNEIAAIKQYVTNNVGGQATSIATYTVMAKDVETNTLSAIERAVYDKDNPIPNVTNVSQYAQSAMDFEVSMVTALEHAKTNGSIRSTREFVIDTFELVTNKLNGIHNIVDGEAIAGVTNVATYIDAALDIETNVVVAVKLAETNGSIRSVHEFVNETFELVTNKVNGIHNIVDNEELAGLTGITNTAAYVSAALEVETNVVVAAKLAETNGSIRSISELVDDTFVLVTNRLNGIHGIVASGEIADITNTAGYVDALMAIETNVVVATKLAESNGSIRTVHEFVGETYDILTNKLYAIHDAIDGWPEPEKDEIDLEITNVAKYVQREMDFSTNLVIMTDKYVPVEMSIWVTNMYENLQAINNWNVVSNFFFAYFGGLASSTEGGEGDVPKIDPKDDPYSGDYESTETKDAMLPVKNARNIVAITNTPLEMIKAERIFDFDVIDTNCINCAELGTSSNVYYLAQLRGFRNANASTGSKIPVKRKQELIQRPDAADYDPETTSGYGIDWMDYPDVLLALSSNDVERVLKWLNDNNISNIFNVVVSNADILAAMSTNLFGHVRAETLLDNDSVWTNGARQIEIKGYHSTAPFTVPYADWGEITNLVDRGGWEDQGWYEEFVDPATGATNEVWRENIVWVPDWQEEVVEGKKMVWEKYPLADSEAWSRYGVASWCTLTNDILAVEDEETGNVKGSVKALSLYGFEGANNAAIAYKHYPTSEDPEGARPQLRWSSPQDDYLPGEDYKYSPISNGMDIKWVPAASAVRVVGTDGSEAVVGVAAQTNTLTFASAADSNVQVGVQGDGNGNVTITIGVYYLNNAGVTPPYVE